MKHTIILALTSTLILFFSGCMGESAKTDANTAKSETAKKCGDGKCGDGGKCGEGKCGDASKPAKNTP